MNGPRVCMYCLAKYHIRVIKYDDVICDIEWRDKYGSPVDGAPVAINGGTVTTQTPRAAV